MGYTRKAGLYVLGPGDIKMFQVAQDNPDLFTKFYLEGWEFLPWQKMVHTATQKEITIIGGYGCGKTEGIGISALVWATTARGFKFMNVANESEQAAQMFYQIVEKTEYTPFWDRFVFKTVEHPFPRIEVAYIIPAEYTHNGKEIVHKGSLEFRSVSEDRKMGKGKGILSWNGDWCNVDEAGLLASYNTLMMTLGTRLRAKARGGRKRLGRLSTVSNSWPNMEMWDRFDMAQTDPEAYLSVTPHTDMNTHITPDQMTDFRRRIEDGDEERWLKGGRPKPVSEHFSAETIAQCQDPGLDDIMEKLLEAEARGVRYEKNRGAGITLWQLPPEEGRHYAIIGDPGQANPPNRNAPVITVWDITDFPNKPATLRLFKWVYGMGRYEPFVEDFLAYKQLYNIMADATFDATGTQRGFDLTFSLLNELMIVGTSLSGNQKMIGLVALKAIMERGWLQFPRGITGFSYQLGIYRLPDTNIPQDIVSVLVMLALWLQNNYYVIEAYEPEEGLEDAPLTSRYTPRTSNRNRGRQVIDPEIIAERAKQLRGDFINGRPPWERR